MPVFRIFLVFLLALMGLSACQPASEVSGDGPWVLNGDASGLTYVTIKNSDLAEINTFRSLSGTVEPDGKAEFLIDLNSVDTDNEIRDGRMKSILFKTGEFPSAKVSAEVDMVEYEALGVGESYTEQLDISLELSGVTWEQKFYVLVTRLGPNKVVVTNKAPLLLDARDFGFGEGLTTLQGLAGLGSITPVVPVTVSLVFER